MNSSLADLKSRLASHPLYAALRTVEDLRHFMTRHVVCVWDFMSLLKSLQRDLTGSDLPWIPAPNPELSRLVNEIVLDEESDLLPDGRCLSHFAWYLEAMTEVGASTEGIKTLVDGLRSGGKLPAALEESGLPPESRAFGRRSLAFLDQNLPVRAAVFLHGREDLIPAMFIRLVAELSARGVSCDLLIGYLERHVAADRDEHGPRAERLLGALLEGDPISRARALAAARQALEARIELWNAILADLPSRREGERRQSV